MIISMSSSPLTTCGDDGVKKCLFGFLFLSFALPCFATTPVTKLPGIVDADSWKHPHPSSAQPAPPPERGKVYDLVQALNQISDNDLNEKTGPAVTILENLRKEDAPDYVKL